MSEREWNVKKKKIMENKWDFHRRKKKSKWKLEKSKQRKKMS